MTRYSSCRSGRPDRLAVLDLMRIAPPTAEGSAPPWPTQEPVLASILTATRERYGQWHFTLNSIDFLTGEAAAIERTSHQIEGRDVITFYGHGSLSVLALTAMKHQRFDLAGISNAWRAPGLGSSHCDLSDIVGREDGAQGATLEMLCAQLGIAAAREWPNSDVAELIAKRQFQKLQNACEFNVAATLMLFACVEGLRARDAGYAGSLVSQFSRWVADCGLTHLRDFERIAGHDEHDRLSLLAMIEEGLAALEHRQHLRSVSGLPGPSGLFVTKASDF